MTRRQPDAGLMKVMQDAKALLAAGDTAGALARYDDAWTRYIAANEPFNASNVAHMAGVADPDPAGKQRWNERALSAADAEPDRESIAGFYPSLYHNLAFSLRLLGREDEARAALRNAWSHVGDLDPGPYGDSVRAAIRKRLEEFAPGEAS